MNKFLTKIATFGLGMIMAIGVGVAAVTSDGFTRASAADGVTKFFDFKEISGFSSWENGYSKKEVKYDEGTVIFEAASKQTGTITDIPVTKGKFVEFKLKSDLGYITSFEFVCRKWTTKPQTITLNTSTNSGTSYTKQSLTSSNFSLTSDFTLADKINALKFTFSSTSNQIGIQSLSITYQIPDKEQIISIDNSAPYVGDEVTLSTDATSATWSITSNGAGASLSSTSGKTVSLSATSAGSVTVKATASGYKDATKTITFEEKPLDPYVTLDNENLEGYTGQSLNISFSSGNLTNVLEITSNNEAVVSIKDVSEDNVFIDLLKAGETTIEFKHSTVTLAACSVVVKQSSVSISGLPTEENLYLGKTIDLGALISVTATGSYNSNVEWDSSDDSIASVDEKGVVTGESIGSAQITVISVSDTNVKATVIINVSEQTECWALQKDTSNLKIGSQIIITNKDCDYALSTEQANNNRKGKAITVSNEEIVDLGEAQILTLEAGSTADTFALSTGSGYLYAAGGNSNNYLKTKDEIDELSSWNIGIEDGIATIKAITSNTRNWLRYNNSNNASIFSCYASGQNDISVFAYVSKTPSEEKAKLDYISITDYQTDFIVGDEFEFGGIVTAHYDDESTQVVTASCTFSGYDMDTVSTQTVTVSYSEGDITEFATYEIVVAEDPTNYGTLENPLTIDEFVSTMQSLNLGHSEQTKKEFYVKGVVSKNDAFNTQYNNYGDKIYFYSESDSNNAEATYAYRAGPGSLDLSNYKDADSLSGATLVLCGFGQVYYSNIQLAQGCTILSAENLPSLELQSISLPGNAEVVVGETLQLNASAYPSSADYELTWSSSKPLVASVEDGLVTPILGNCDVEITATVVGKPEISATCLVRTKLPEMVSRNEGTSEPVVTEVNATLTFDNTSKRTELTTEKQVWEENGVTVTNNKASSTIPVADYSNPARFYKNSEIIIKALGNIKQINFVTSGSDYSSALSSSIGESASADGLNVIVNLDGSLDTFECKLTGGQVRLKSLTVVYLETSEGGSEGDPQAKEWNELKTFIDTYMKLEEINLDDEGSGACLTNFETVAIAYNSLSEEAKVLLETDSHARVVAAWNRLQNWAKANNHSFNNHELKATLQYVLLGVDSAQPEAITLIIVAVLISLSAVAFIYYRKRQTNAR